MYYPFALGWKRRKIPRRISICMERKSGIVLKPLAARDFGSWASPVGYGAGTLDPEGPGKGHDLLGLYRSLRSSQGGVSETVEKLRGLGVS